MIIEIITTGDEVLTGFTVDTNASWLSQQLLENGWQVRRRQTVGDRMDDLTDVLHECSLIADVIIFNGGLGPTSDDKTTDAVSVSFRRRYNDPAAADRCRPPIRNPAYHLLPAPLHGVP